MTGGIIFLEEVTEMIKSSIITIGRQYGSNGRAVGIELARRENIPYYDKEILARAAEGSGISQGVFEDCDENTRRLSFAMALDPYSLGYSINPASRVSTEVSAAFDNAIKEIANEGPCIIIGRHADFILHEYKKVLRIFLYAPFDMRVKTVMEREDLSENEASKLIKKVDKERAQYYSFYTSQKWGAKESYDVCLNTGLFGVEDTVTIIQRMLELQENKPDMRPIE